MKDKEDLEQLTGDFVDLWRDYLAQTITDPSLVRWTTGWLAGLPSDAFSKGTEAARDASGAFGERLDELAGRIASCEERLDSLEWKSRSKSKKASGSPRRNRS